jgi:hypothetical protein
LERRLLGFYSGSNMSRSYSGGFAMQVGYLRSPANEFELRVRPWPDRPDAAVVDLRLQLLHAGESLRSRPLDEDHLSSLIEALALWPPLLVHKGTMTVVDGLHRLEAARRLRCFRARSIRRGESE